MNKLVSIIVPLFNKEKYILRCLNSLIEQDYKNIEIIVVDDGSTDNSKVLVNKMNDKRIKLFSIENQGVSNARNFGLLNCKGAYVTFVDADDYVKKNYISLLKSNMKKNCDLVVMSRIEVGTELKQINFFDYEGKINEIPKKFYISGFCHSVWGKLYKMEIIKDNNIIFPKCDISEDSFFNLKYLSCSSIIRCINMASYYYIKYNENNLTSFSKIEYLQIYGKLFESYSSFFEDKKYDCTKEIMYPQFYNLLIKLLKNNKICVITKNKLFQEVYSNYIKKICKFNNVSMFEKIINICIAFELWKILKLVIIFIDVKDRYKR